MEMKDALNFEKMLTPKIIMIVYYLGLAGVLIGGLKMIFSGAFFPGLGMIIFGALAVRIWCELFIVLFQLNKNVQKIAETK